MKDFRNAALLQIAGQNFGGNIEEAHVRKPFRRNFFHRRNDDVGADFDGDIIDVGIALCLFRDERAVAAADFELDGVPVAEHGGIVDERAEMIRSLFGVAAGLAPCEQQRAERAHARF